MEMEIGRIQLLRQVLIEQRIRPVWRQLVDQPNTQGVTRLDAQRWPGGRSFVGAREEPVAAGVDVGVVGMELGFEYPVDRSTNLGLDQIDGLPWASGRDGSAAGHIGVFVVPGLGSC